MTSHIRLEITPAAAMGLVQGALDHARANGWEVAVAVVDPYGYLVAFGRSDNASPPVGEFAIDKAYTAGTLRRSSKSFGERMASSPRLSLGLGSRPRLMAWGGGVAVVEGETCIGGLGVSGAQEHEDIACAEAALRALGLGAG
ncbi:GlcG/HbpS family heme-binding protein [Sinisalibacter aestuarii]|uniref:DNA polymerase III subunit delta n=1 Tax=Sinisalibacter aestuarii TaxID=2949426 RepID=A0ABQ5M0E1_9RHOB|nr:heme-binding protein [Sinisalibacter aestuarii]GKY89992.1 DNA polymerase III subunit delta' [Sinisalibacter aestuarii]